MAPLISMARADLPGYDVCCRCGAVGPAYTALVKQLYSVLAPAKGQAALELLGLLLQGQLTPGQLVEECCRLQAGGGDAAGATAV